MIGLRHFLLIWSDLNILIGADFSDGLHLETILDN